jgi:hypothetical protein
MLRLTLIADYLNNSGSADGFDFSSYFGGNSIGGQTINYSSSALRKRLSVVIEIFALNASNAQAVILRYVDSVGTNISGNISLAVNSSLDQVLAITFKHTTADALIEAKLYAAQLELL